MDGPFKGHLTWNGSQDLQDVSIEIIKVTFNDSGVYECNVLREFVFDYFTPSVSITKHIKLKVKEKGAAQTFPLSSMLFGPVLFAGLDRCSVPVSIQLSVKSSCDSVLR